MKGLLITGNPLITVGNTAAAPFAILHPRFENGTDFIAGILSVPLVHDVQERSKVIVRGIGAVNIVVDSDEPNTLGRKLNFCVKSNFQIIASETAHVLYNDSCNVPGFDFGNHGLEAGTVKIRSTVSIVRKMLDVVKAVFASVIFQILFLIQNAVRFTLQLIISGKPFVQCRDFSLVGFCHSFTFFCF